MLGIISSIDIEKGKGHENAALFGAIFFLMIFGGIMYFLALLGFAGDVYQGKAIFGPSGSGPLSAFCIFMGTIMAVPATIGYFSLRRNARRKGRTLGING